MKNQLIKNTDNTLIAVILAGSLAAGALVYLFLTDSGKTARSDLKKKAKDKVKDVASTVISTKTGLSKKAIKKVADRIVK